MTDEEKIRLRMKDNQSDFIFCKFLRARKCKMFSTKVNYIIASFMLSFVHCVPRQFFFMAFLVKTGMSQMVDIMTL